MAHDGDVERGDGEPRERDVEIHVETGGDGRYSGVVR